MSDRLPSGITRTEIARQGSEVGATDSIGKPDQIVTQLSPAYERDLLSECWWR